MSLSRRTLLRGTAAALVAGATSSTPTAEAAGEAANWPDLALGPITPFSTANLIARAKAQASVPFAPTPPVAPGIIDRIDYDAYQQISWKPDKSLMLGAGDTLPIQLFHLGNQVRESVKIHILRDGIAREVLYSPALFETPLGHPSRDLPPTAGFAGFRVMAPGQKPDWLAFLGASYFRSSGPYDQYGLSARGLAIDTGLATAEEFPRFTEFWLEGGTGKTPQIIIHALLESQSVTGAYRITAERVSDAKGVYTVPMDIDCTLFARQDIKRLGLAPFSSMYWYSETRRPKAADWRPEIHDSDGLEIWTGAGERIWRPLNNPDRVITSSFVDQNPNGFGLLQRDRDFGHYLDDGVFYERRPSVWVEPIEPFGDGAVHLLEIPTNDEIHDNIAAYWCPSAAFAAGTERRYRYRLTWLDDAPRTNAALGRATGLWTGLGGRPAYKRPEGTQKFVIDFEGAIFDGLGRDDGVEIIVSASRGEISNAFTHPVERHSRRWRALFDVTAGRSTDPVDLRLHLRRGATPLTETWLYQWFPE